MAGSEGGGRKWLSCGCCGCLAIVVLILLIVGGLLGLARMQVKGQAVAEQTLEPPEVVQPGEPTSAKPGRVALRLKSAEFYVKPAAPGESLHLEARYDKSNYELTERFEDGAERWTYEIDFAGKRSWLLQILGNLLGGEQSRVEVFLPLDVPLELELELAQGGCEMELGGLWITSADIAFSQGGFAMGIDEPLRAPMDSLSIRGSMGGFAASRLGHASPRRLEVDYRMGGMDLDLRGEWRVDSEITLRMSQGGGNVRLPKNVRIVGLDEGRVGPPAVVEEVPRPTLTFTVSSTQGELEFE